MEAMNEEGFASLANDLEMQKERTEYIMRNCQCLHGLWENEVAIHHLRTTMSGKDVEQASISELSECISKRIRLLADLKTFFPMEPSRDELHEETEYQV
jgi:hypothetical protein